MLAELLELIHSSDRRWSTLQATLHRWTDPAAIDRASERRDARSRFLSPRSRPPGLPHHPLGDPADTVAALTATCAGSVRLERPAAGPDEDRLTVSTPEGYLSVRGSGRTDRALDVGLGFGALAIGPVAVLLDPAQLLSPFRWEAGGPASVAGRECLTATCVERERNPRWGGEGWGRGVDRLELAADRQTGILLRLHLLGGDELTDRLELADPRWDQPVDPAAFSLELPEDGHVEDFPGMRTPAVLARDVPFTLFAPATTPQQLGWSGHLRRCTRDGVQVTSVFLMQPGSSARRGGLAMISQTTSGSDLPDVTQWRPVELPGGDGHAWVEDGGVHLVFWRSGTGIWLRQLPDLPAALALAGSMRPVLPADTAEPAT